MNGVLLVDKPVGISSHAAVARVRRATGVRRVGHAGTLDPGASGLLVLGIGAGTRLLTFMVGLDKSYEATIRLGITTDSDDADGHVMSSLGCPADAPVEAGLAAFRGPIRQRPSAVSAIKIDGRRAYQRVRSGENVELPARPVVVHALDVLAARSLTIAMADSVQVRVLDVDVSMSVSSGTYVRAVARDLGIALGCGGHLTSLRRTSVGPFGIAEAIPLEADVHVPSSAVIPLGSAAARVLPVWPVPAADRAAVTHGARMTCDLGDQTGPVALLSESGDLLSVASCSDGRWRHHFVVPSDTLEPS